MPNVSTPSTASKPTVTTWPDRVTIEDPKKGDLYTYIPPTISTSMNDTDTLKPDYFWNPSHALRLESNIRPYKNGKSRRRKESLSFRTPESRNFEEKRLMYGESVTWRDEECNPHVVEAPSGKTGRLVITPAILKLTPSEGQYMDQVWGLAPLGKVICSHGSLTYDENGDVGEENGVTMGPGTGISQVRFDGAKFVPTEAGSTEFGLASVFAGLHLKSDSAPDDDESEIE
jgi:hypothetical protein